LIGLATQTLVMATGSTIGAAAPVQTGAPGVAAQPTDEKTVSYLRKEFRATSEARKRPLLLAEAMVDADVEVHGVVDRGKLLTLTTDAGEDPCSLQIVLLFPLTMIIIYFSLILFTLSLISTSFTSSSNIYNSFSSLPHFFYRTPFINNIIISFSYNNHNQIFPLHYPHLSFPPYIFL
jgi:hypothetical protein